MDIKKRINIEYILLLGTFLMVCGVLYGFSMFLLIGRGYSSSEAGTCLSLASLLNIVLSLIISNFLDHSKKISAFEVVCVTFLVVFVLFVINYCCPEKSLLLTICTILVYGLYSLSEPLINVLSSSLLKSNIKIEFSVARGIGSIFFSAVCAIFGVLSNYYSYRLILMAGAVFSVLVLIILLILRRDFYSIKVVEKENIENISFKDFFVNNKKYVLMCISLSIIFIAYIGVDNFMLQVCQEIGGNQSDTAKIYAFKAFLEFLAMLVFPKIKNKIKLNSIITISSFAFFAKQLAIYLSPTIAVLYCIQIFQSLSFGLMMPSMIEYVYQNMSTREAVRGNALFTNTICIGSIVSGICGGNIIDLFGIKTWELAAVVLTFFGAICMSVVINKKYEKE